MRYAIISDIHANLAAFRAVLADIERRGGVAKVWCLGDTIGYGPDPHECLELLRQTNYISVAGNHEWAATGQIDTSLFNPEAAQSCQWTIGQLSAADVEYIRNMPLVLEEGDFTLAHGSPREPIWEYLLSAKAVEENLAYFQTRFCLVGHSHVPLVFSCREDRQCSVRPFSPDSELTLRQERLIINPGAVGQPRDGDHRASYAIYDSESRQVKLYRVPYDIRLTQRRMTEYGLPPRLIMRLSYGR